LRIFRKGERGKGKERNDAIICLEGRKPRRITKKGVVNRVAGVEWRAYPALPPFTRNRNLRRKKENRCQLWTYTHNGRKEKTKST